MISLKGKYVDYIEVNGHLDYRRVTPWDYEETRMDFYPYLPLFENLHYLGNPDKLWTLLCGYPIKIHFTDGDVLEYRLIPGFTHDKVSIPILKDNALAACLETPVHDVNFSLKPFPFMQVNRLFYQMLRCKKLKFRGEMMEVKPMNWLGANLYHFFVNSLGGIIRWKRTWRYNHTLTVSIYYNGERVSLLSSHRKL